VLTSDHRKIIHEYCRNWIFHVIEADFCPEEKTVSGVLCPVPAGAEPYRPGHNLARARGRAHAPRVATSSSDGSAQLLSQHL
jgi:hypothetical protein